MPEPCPTPPRFQSGYGLPGNVTGASKLPWSWADERLSAARNYWIATTRPGGRPDVAPVWGIWLDGAFYFSTDGGSRKGRNLVANGAAVLHLESGDEVVIVHGQITRLVDETVIDRVSQVYQRKYDISMKVPGVEPFILELRPSLAFTWLDSDCPNTATR